MAACPACETDIEVLDGNEDLDVDDSFSCPNCSEVLIVTSIEPLEFELDPGEEDDDDEEDDDEEDEDDEEEDDEDEDDEEDDNE